MAVASGTLPWFFAREFRLQWRELWAGFGDKDRVRRTMLISFALLIFAALHALAVYLLRPWVEGGVTPDIPTLATLTAGASFFVLMSLSQAIESVTRAYYTRGDFDLILSSPAPARSVFWARTGIVALTAAFLAAIMVSPFVNVLVFLDGPRWLTVYPVALMMSGVVTAIAVLITLALFHFIGARHTRLAAQVLSAIVGAALFVGIQTSLILAKGGPGNITSSIADLLLGITGGDNSPIFLPARAAMGDWPVMVMLAIFSAALVFVALAVSGRSFARLALGAISQNTDSVRSHKSHRFSSVGAMALLRRKEWRLILRDPWLISQSLMQLLYLIPLFALVILTASDSAIAGPALAAMLAMASGQLSGGLAWLTLSGEQAHDLIMTAPLPRRAVHAAKLQAIAAMVAAVILPILLGLAFFAPQVLPVATAGAFLASASAVTVQFLFRGRGNRRHFARREGSPRLATLIEALAAVAWAGATGVAVYNPIAGLIAALPAMMIVLAVWLVRRNATTV